MILWDESTKVKVYRFSSLKVIISDERLKIMAATNFGSICITRRK